MKKESSILSQQNNRSRIAGSQNKNTFFQPKLSINQPHDPDSYRDEQEADAMADKVMQMPASRPEMPFFQPKLLPVAPAQRKCSTCKNEEKLQREEDKMEETAIQ